MVVYKPPKYPILKQEMIKPHSTVFYSTPFVTKTNGHSEWFVIDHSRYSSVAVIEDLHTATLRGSLLQKEVAVHLAEKGIFTGYVYESSAVSL